MAIVLDGQVLSAPTIQSRLDTGGQITGNFTQAQANDLGLQLKYGALPVPLHVELQEPVGASLGAEFVAATGRAGVLGVGVILIFMIILYRVPGVLAALALLLFAAINFALYKFIPVTLTLPAITGLPDLDRYGSRRQHPDFRAYQRRTAARTARSKKQSRLASRAPGRRSATRTFQR